jgi:hypothetical protein
MRQAKKGTRAAVTTKAKERAPQGDVEARFAEVVKAFARDRAVRRAEGKGFGSGSLQVNGKIFAMISSKGRFVVKLPKERVDELVASGEGERFGSGGRVMREWAEVGDAGPWVELAREAHRFVRGGGG